MNRPYKVYAGPYRAPSFETRAAAFRHAQQRANEGHSGIVQYCHYVGAYPQRLKEFAAHEQFFAEVAK